MRLTRAHSLLCILAVILPMHAKPIYAAASGCGSITVPRPAHERAPARAARGWNGLAGAQRYGLERSLSGLSQALKLARIGGNLQLSSARAARVASKTPPRLPSPRQLARKGAVGWQKPALSAESCAHVQTAS
jgi:hypothetical protein